MSSSTCAEAIRAYTEHLGEGFACRESGGRLWLVSPYSFPDGDQIEITVKELPSGEALLTDLGETFRHLASLGFDPRDSQKGAYVVERIMYQHHTTLDRGVVVRRVGLAQIGAGIQQLLNACLAVAHLSVLSRGYRPATFAEEVAQFLAESEIPVTPHHHEKGKTEKRYEVEILVKGRTGDALVQPLSPATLATATQMVNATFRMWCDLENGRWRGSVLDDRLIHWRPEDIRLLAGVSQVYQWSDAQVRLVSHIREACFERGFTPDKSRG